MKINNNHDCENCNATIDTIKELIEMNIDKPKPFTFEMSPQCNYRNGFVRITIEDNDNASIGLTTPEDYR